MQVSWFRAFLLHEKEKYRLHRKTNLVIALLLVLVSALFITLTIVDRGRSHAGRCATFLASAGELLMSQYQDPMPAQAGVKCFTVPLLCTMTTSGCSRRAQWLAVLFGPFGCTLRWLLSKYNYKLHGHWKWLPVGTFAANMIACIVDYILGVRVSWNLTTKPSQGAHLNMCFLRGNSDADVSAARQCH